MAQATPPGSTLPPHITLEFYQVEASPDDSTRRIEIGHNRAIISGDGLCVVEIHNMQGEAIASLRLKETSRWLAQNNYRYVAGTNGLYRRISNWSLDWSLDWSWLSRFPKVWEADQSASHQFDHFTVAQSRRDSAPSPR